MSSTDAAVLLQSQPILLAGPHAFAHAGFRLRRYDLATAESTNQFECQANILSEIKASGAHVQDVGFDGKKEETLTHKQWYNGPRAAESQFFGR